MNNTKQPRIMSFILLGALLTIVMLVLGACGSGTSRLVGQWEATSATISGDWGSDTEEIPAGEFTFEFFSDGTGVETDGNWSHDFTWTSDNGRLRITDDWGTETADYSFSSNRSILTLVFIDGDETLTLTLRRMN
ncbi:MAG: lipocalin family protein [Defluviitaleaceae bacterium]|nr:lipocalin family protein [Defluviitaleaceae bacterium]